MKAEEKKETDKNRHFQDLDLHMNEEDTAQTNSNTQ